MAVSFLDDLVLPMASDSDRRNVREAAEAVMVLRTAG
jgi:hypothetical protein